MLCWICCLCIFFKQKTACEMRISDWSSDVCSSDHQQKQIFVYVTKRLPRWGAGKLDATGNGDYLAEAAAQEFGGERIERVKLSQGWYAQNNIGRPSCRARVCQDV